MVTENTTVFASKKEKEKKGERKRGRKEEKKGDGKRVRDLNIL